MSENNDKKQEINKNPEVKSSQEVTDQKAKDQNILLDLTIRNHLK